MNYTTQLMIKQEDFIYERLSGITLYSILMSRIVLVKNFHLNSL